MKKTVVFEFPDDFKFPEYYGQKNTTQEIIIAGSVDGAHITETRPSCTCFDGCPFDSSIDDYSMCFLTGGL